MSTELRDRLQGALGAAYLLERELGGGGMSRVFVATVAKAIESSTGEASLTSLGVALGTPAYMAPEQAARWSHRGTE